MKLSEKKFKITMGYVLKLLAKKVGNMCVPGDTKEKSYKL